MAMVRTTFTKKLKALGEIPTPKGHSGRNKGISSYFFAPEKTQEVKNFLQTHLGQPTKPGRPYPDEALQYMTLTQTEPQHVQRSVMLWPPNPTQPFASVSICIWRG